MTDGEPICPCISCHDYGDRDQLDAIDRNTIAHVSEHGWSVMHIPEGELGPGLAFTAAHRSRFSQSCGLTEMSDSRPPPPAIQPSATGNPASGFDPTSIREASGRKTCRPVQAMIDSRS